MFPLLSSRTQSVKTLTELKISIRVTLPILSVLGNAALLVLGFFPNRDFSQIFSIFIIDLIEIGTGKGVEQRHFFVFTPKETGARSERVRSAAQTH